MWLIRHRGQRSPGPSVLVHLEALDHAGSCGSRIRTGDLRVMSPASCRTATIPLEPTIGHDPMTCRLQGGCSTI